MRANWSSKDIQILIDNYSKMGASYCASLLDKTLEQVQRKVHKLQLKIESIYTYENINNNAKISISYSDLARKLGLSPNRGNRKTIQKYISIFSVDVSHFTFKYSSKKRIIKYELCDILIENSPYRNNTSLKKRLFAEGLKENKCEFCGLGDVWMGIKISLILDHINGINSDYRIENLRIICPNCNATTETFCKGNIESHNRISMIRNSIVNEKYICICGDKKDIKAKKCINCYNKIRFKVVKPDYETLCLEVKELGYVGTGKKYGVSDNAVRKWKKKYENASIV